MIIENCSAETNRQGQELAAHGTALLPVACYADDLSRRAVGWHWHDEFEAAVVTRGSALLCVGARQQLIAAGDGFFINAGALHSIRAAAPGESAMRAVVFHPRLVGGSAESVFWQRYLLPLMQNPCMEYAPLCRAQNWSARILQSLTAAWDFCRSEGTGYEFAMRAALSEVIYGIWQHTPADGVAAPRKMLRDSERTKQMLRHIQAHYDEPLTLEQIAASASVSKSECLRCFKSVMQTTPVQYIRQYRLQRAAELLGTGDAKISDVAEACGFREMSYFARAFRQFTGMAPREYQKQQAR